MMQSDVAGNTLTRSRMAYVSRGLYTIRDTLSRSDRSDVYRFFVGQRSRLDTELLISYLGGDADVELLRIKGSRSQVMNRIGNIPLENLTAAQWRENLVVLARTARSRNVIDRFSLNLEPGEYFLRVFWRTTVPSYRLQANLTPVPFAPLQQNWVQQLGNLSAATASAVAQQSAQQFGGGGNDYAYGTTVDRQGNVYVAGTIKSNVDSRDDRDPYVAKYSPTGQRLWFRVLNEVRSPRLDLAYDVAVDTANNYYVVGVRDAARGSTDALTRGVGTNGFLAKYNPNGRLLWRRFIGNNFVADAITGVALDATGNVYTSGFMNLGLGGGGRAVVQSFTSAGRDRWTVNLPSPTANTSSALFDIAVRNNNVYVGGISRGVAQLNLDNPFRGGEPMMAMLNATNGASVWRRSLPRAAGGGAGYVRSLSVDRDGNAYAVSNFTGAKTGYLTRLDNRGAINWQRRLGTIGPDEAQGVAVSNNGRIFVVGESNGSFFNERPLGGSDAYLMEFDAVGNNTQRRLIGTSSDDEAYGVAIGPSGQVVVTGQTLGVLGERSEGGYDAWLMQLT